MSTKQPNEFSSAERAQLMSFLHGSFIKTGTKLEAKPTLATMYESRDKVVETLRHMEKSNRGHRALRIVLRNVTGLQSTNGVKCIGNFQRAAEACGFIARPEISMRKLEINDGKHTLHINDLTFHVHRKTADMAASFSVTSKDEPAPKAVALPKPEAGRRLKRSDIADVKQYLQYALGNGCGFSALTSGGNTTVRVHGYEGSDKEAAQKTEDLALMLTSKGFVCKTSKPRRDTRRSRNLSTSKLILTIVSRQGFSLRDVTLLPINEARLALATEIIRRELKSVLTRKGAQGLVRTSWGVSTAELSMFARVGAGFDDGADNLVARVLKVWKDAGFEAVHTWTYAQSKTSVRLDFELRSLSVLALPSTNISSVIPSPIEHPALTQIVPMMTVVLMAESPIGPHLKVLITGSEATPTGSPSEAQYQGIHLQNLKHKKLGSPMTFDACQIRQLLISAEKAVDEIADALDTNY